MENPKYILVMRQVASDYDGISHELFQIANNLERMDQFNPQQKLFSLVRNAEVSTVSLRNLTARTVRDDTAHFYGEVADLLGIRIDETHDWLKITVPAILPKRNQRDNQAFLTRPLRYALLDFLKENPMERFGSCAICIVHNYDEALGTVFKIGVPTQSPVSRADSLSLTTTRRESWLPTLLAMNRISRLRVTLTLL